MSVMTHQFSPDTGLHLLHERVHALRRLTDHGIPCILWGVDALNIAHNVRLTPSDHEILVPDDMLYAAASILRQSGIYKTTREQAKDYVVNDLPRRGEYAVPRSYRLVNTAISEQDRLKFIEPRHILLLPQSYYNVNTSSVSRFQSLVPPLAPENKDILIPKYNTMLEGLAHFIIYPPTGCFQPFSKQVIYIRRLLDSRLDPGGTAMHADISHEILSEITTEDAMWYMHISLLHGTYPEGDRIELYARHKGRARTQTEERILLGCMFPDQCDERLSLIQKKKNFGHQTILMNFHNQSRVLDNDSKIIQYATPNVKYCLSTLFEGLQITARKVHATSSASALDDNYRQFRHTPAITANGKMLDFFQFLLKWQCGEQISLFGQSASGSLTFVAATAP
ncbi:hypothetical protein BDN70DRAFT_917399 [Pholiota conissans]|uniref:Uncharacterized protein n=1 Tax=Pholiota conissans TaxID=109636 RepID=A0A9P5ZC90_9AGAR|nr:hypothetical protein BDN70DRAFT_917399 [Pholiota conissans]